MSDTDKKSTAPKGTEKPQAPEAAGETLVDAVEAFEQRYAAEISARVKAGLTREQAVACQRAQIRHDAALAAEAKKAAAKK